MASTTPSQTNCRASSALSHCDRERPTTSGRSQASLTTYNATTGEKTGRRPGRFLSYKPSRPYATKRSAHLRTCRSRNSTCLAVAAKVCPSANSRMARARLARPAGVFCRRSHPDKVVRVGSSISIWSADLRPCMASSRLVLCRSYGKSTSLCPVFQPLFNGDLYLGLVKELFPLVTLSGVKGLGSPWRCFATLSMTLRGVIFQQLLLSIRYRETPKA